MAKEEKRSPISLTPPPEYSSASLAKAIIEGRADTKVIKEDLLPPLIKDAREARDKARESLQKVNAHIDDTDSHEHPCIEGPRQGRQDDDIGLLKGETIETKAQVGNTSKLVWWLMGIAVTVALIVGGFAVSIRVTAAENVTNIGSIVEDVDDNVDSIKELRKVQRQDRELYLREVRLLPTKVRQAAVSKPPTIEQMEDTADDIGLNDREQRQLMSLLKRARNRGNGNE